MKEEKAYKHFEAAFRKLCSKYEYKVANGEKVREITSKVISEFQ